MYWELEKDGCESEFIVGSFENRICMYAQVKFESRFLRDTFSVIIESTFIHLVSKCAERQYNHSTIQLIRIENIYVA